MRPIDADAFKKAILEERDKIPLEIVERYSFGVATPNKHGESMRGGIRKALRCLEETPTLDVEPVRHGRWKKRKSWDKYVCSECGFEHDEPHNYCPNPHCGAKMDAKEE